MKEPLFALIFLSLLTMACAHSPPECHPREIEAIDATVLERNGPKITATSEAERESFAEDFECKYPALIDWYNMPNWEYGKPNDYEDVRDCLRDQLDFYNDLCAEHQGTEADYKDEDAYYFGVKCAVESCL